MIARHRCFVVTCSAVCVCVTGIGVPGTTSVQYVTQPVDHFDRTHTGTWRQAYYAVDGNWSGNQSDAPVFVCIGGEGPMTAPQQDIVTDWLPRTGGLLFAVEHRYYGCHDPASCPYDVANPPENYLRFLSSQQALADLAAFKVFATKKYGLAQGTKWVLVGGSYPGILAALGRALYPQHFFAAIAASAPVRGVVDFRGFEDTVSDAYALDVEGIHGSEACRTAIIEGHKQISDYLRSPPGRKYLVSFFALEDPDALATEDNRRTFAGCGVAHFPAQVNDPLCQKPGCGIKQICRIMTENASTTSVLERLRKLRDIQGANKVRKDVSLDGIMLNCEMDTAWEMASYIPHESLYWAYQTCNEFGFYQSCEHGSKCLYTRGLISFHGDGVRKPDSFCATRFGISAEDVAAKVAVASAFRHEQISAATRILWINGDVDPWNSRSFHVSPGREQPVIWPVSGASHCAWMTAARNGEQQSLVKARAQIYTQVMSWLREPIQLDVEPDKQTGSVEQDLYWPVLRVLTYIAMLSGLSLVSFTVSCSRSWRSMRGIILHKELSEPLNC